MNLSDLPLNPWGDLRIEGYIGGKKVISKSYSGKGIDAQLLVEPDDTQLLGDGIDVTRVVLRATDEYGNTQQFSSGAVRLTIEGQGRSSARIRLGWWRAQELFGYGPSRAQAR